MSEKAHNGTCSRCGGTVAVWCDAMKEYAALAAQMAQARGALNDSAESLRHAWSMLSAICETDTSVDRRAARDAAATASAKAFSALSTPAPRVLTGTTYYANVVDDGKGTRLAYLYRDEADANRARDKSSVPTTREVLNGR